MQANAICLDSSRPSLCCAQSRGANSAKQFGEQKCFGLGLQNSSLLQQNTRCLANGVGGASPRCRGGQVANRRHLAANAPFHLGLRVITAFVALEQFEWVGFWYQMASPWPDSVPPCRKDDILECYFVDCGPHAWLAAYSGIPGAMEVDTRTTVKEIHDNALVPRPHFGVECWLQSFAMINGASLVDSLQRNLVLLELRDACHGCQRG